MTESRHARTSTHTSSILYEDWKHRIYMATDLPELMQVIREYLAGWRPEELKHLPAEIASTAIDRAEDIVARAVVATREELNYRGDAHGHQLLNEMTLTMAAAASRLRGLQSLRLALSR